MHRRVDELLTSMSTEEKIGQLSQVFSFGASASTDEKIRKGQLGSILFTTDPKQINRMQHIAVEESSHHIPLLFAFDVIHGLRTIFPVPIAMAASWDPSVAKEAQRLAASEARAVGVDWTFAPMVDIARDARWGRIVEGAGEIHISVRLWRELRFLDFKGRTLASRTVLWLPSSTLPGTARLRAGATTMPRTYRTGRCGIYTFLRSKLPLMQALERQ